MIPPPSSPETIRCGKRLAELCSSRRFEEAMRELYADESRHVEAVEMPGSPDPRIVEGKDALLKKNDEFMKANTVHSSSCSEPRFNGDQFICEMGMDVSMREGPMAGQRTTMRESALYTVRDGQIVEAMFFSASRE